MARDTFKTPYDVLGTVLDWMAKELEEPGAFNQMPWWVHSAMVEQYEKGEELGASMLHLSRAVEEMERASRACEDLVLTDQDRDDALGRVAELQRASFVVANNIRDFVKHFLT